MKEPIFLKKDRRFKKGNIKIEREGLRGHPDTLNIDRAKVPHLKELHHHHQALEDMYYTSLNLQLNPPIIVGRELGEKLKEVL